MDRLPVGVGEHLSAQCAGGRGQGVGTVERRGDGTIEVRFIRRVMLSMQSADVAQYICALPPSSLDVLLVGQWDL